MKLKKFFAGVLAAAMMLTVGATAAFATEPSNKTISVKDNGGNAKMFQTGDATLTLTKSLEVKNGTAPNEMEFTFSVADSSNTAVAGATTAARFEAGQDKEIKAFVAGKNYTANFTVDIEKLLGDTKKNTVGEYTYTLSEDTVKYPGVSANDSALTMKITVVNQLNDQKQPIANSYGYYVALYRGGNKIEAKDAFKNSYDSKSLILSKTVHGALADLNKDFTFTIKFTKDTGVDANNTWDRRLVLLAPMFLLNPRVLRLLRWLQIPIWSWISPILSLCVITVLWNFLTCLLASSTKFSKMVLK